MKRQRKAIASAIGTLVLALIFNEGDGEAIENAVATIVMYAVTWLIPNDRSENA